MVFQRPNPFPKSIFENVAYGLRVNGVKDNEFIRHRVEETLKGAALWDEVKNKLKESAFDHSGGQQQRVAIARAIVLNPRYLFCDEPNSGLDPQTSIVIDNLIHEITCEYNITTIINTHDMNSVMEIGEKIVYIHEGRKWWEGTKDDILHADNPELNDFVFASAMAKRAKRAAK